MSDMDYEEEDDDFVESDYESDGASDAFEAPPVQATEHNFRVLTPEECLARANAQVQEVVELLCCEQQVAQLLLRHFRWDRDKLTDAYMADPDAVAAKAGVRTLDGSDRSILHVRADGASSSPSLAKVLVGGVPTPPSSLQPVQCSICYDTTKTYSALACGHPFCNTCYTDFLGHKIADEGHECYFARCPEPKCGLVVSTDLVHSLVTDEDKLRRYSNAASLARSFVDDQATLKWCPAPDCGKAVQSRASGPSSCGIPVRCSCQHRFCFSCMQEDHSPASCHELQQWTIKCRDDSETYNWLVANTKACPKCQTSIEKNGGCNHMTCKNTSCKYEFCWVCCGPWKDHSGSYYNCNKYDPEKDKDTVDGKKKDSSRKSLERYLHYYTRYTNHHNSLKFEIEAQKKMEDKRRDMEALGDNTWMDCQYLNEANEALHNCRYTLKFTYVYAFYLPPEDSHRHNFEMQQTELERQTEELAELLERDAKEIQRMEVVHCYKMAEKRLSNLMELVHAHHGEDERQASAEAGSSSSDPIQLG